jgi:hypothetical protein
MSNWQELGAGHRVELVRSDASGIRSFIDEHPRRDTGVQCAGSGRLLEVGQANPNDGRAYWTIIHESPLTLTPSLLCTACGDHGWINDGKWVKAE